MSNKLSLQKHVELFDKLAVAKGYLEWVATMNEAIALASKNKAHPDTIHDLVGVSNFLIDGCLDGIDIEAESVALNKAKGVAA